MTDQDFYRLQNQWSKIYFRDITKGDLDRVLWINQLTGLRGVRILELGAGGGKFSVTACQLKHKVTAVEIEPHFVEHISTPIQRYFPTGSKTKRQVQY